MARIVSLMTVLCGIAGILGIVGYVGAQWLLDFLPTNSLLLRLAGTDSLVVAIILLAAALFVAALRLNKH